MHAVILPTGIANSYATKQGSRDMQMVGLTMCGASTLSQ